MIRMSARQEGVPTLFVTGLFQFFTLILLIIALLHQQQGLVLLALFILVMFNGALLWCRLSLTGLDCRLALTRAKVFPGDNLILEVIAINNKHLPVWLQLAVTVDRFLLPPDFSPPQPFSASPPGAPLSDSFGQGKPPIPVTTKEVLRGEGGLLGRQQARRQWELVAGRRGIYRVGPLSLAAGDLFGFYQQEKIFPQTQTVIVYPRLLYLNPLAAPLRELFGAPGANSPVVDPVYPVATRDYQAGRPARHIHWKASARHGQLQEKMFEPSARQKILLVVDVEQFHREKAPEALERVLEVAATLAVEFTRRGHAIGFISNGLLKGEEGLPARLPPGRGPAQLFHLLELLARLQARPQRSMELELQREQMGPTHGVTCLYFSYRPAVQMTDPAWSLFKRLHIPIVFVVADPAVAGMPLSGNAVCCLDTLIAGEVSHEG